MSVVIRKVLPEEVAELKVIPESQINSGGYVIHSMEAALWCLANTASYED